MLRRWPFTSTCLHEGYCERPFLGKSEDYCLVGDVSGRAVFHCHILEDEVNGMMGVWEIT